jgi:DNA-binding transcriptional regulator LsrR (DeoR family)
LAHLKRQGSPDRPYRKLHGELLEQAKDLYLAGASQLAIAHELGITRTAVRSGLLAAGVKLRDRRASP